MNKKQLTNLYRKYNRDLVSSLQKVGFVKENAEDIAQDVWLKMFETDMKDIKNIRGFLYTVAIRIGYDLRNRNRMLIDVPKDIVKSISDNESFRRWQNTENDSNAYDKLISAVCLAAIHTTSFGTTILDVIEDQLNGMTQQEIATKYRTTRQSVSIELKKWYRKIRDTMECKC